MLVWVYLVRGHFSYAYPLIPFPKLSDAKINEVLDRPQVRVLLKDPVFESKMTQEEVVTWQSFREVTTKFLENFKDFDYKNI